MAEDITYGVFWQSRYGDDFKPFFTWVTTYDAAYKVYKDVLKNPDCKAARIVERTEHFEIVAERKLKEAANEPTL